MEQPKSINSKQAIPEAMDFNFLRKEGIKRIQELTGSFWTDYNLHDPGVTILEQLCYGITDLAYRTSIDIEQHLFSKKGEKLPFFVPEDTLTISALTIEDYRKIFIDTIPQIKNIWFEPVKQFECGFNGLYRILVNISEVGPGKESNREEILNEIRSLFSKTRNLGEDIYEIKILEELPISVHADIETDGIHELELILAQIYFEIEQLLAPEIQFYSLNELKNKGLSYNKIFNGPRLKHGFILTEDLIPQQTTIVVSDIVRGIIQIEGVISVKQLYIKADGQEYHAQFNIPEGKIPRIITSDLFSGRSNLKSEINFFKGSLEYTGVSPKAFKRFLNELVSENKKSFRISESSITLPSEGTDESYSEYYSVQNHFPAIYGVGHEGIPGRPGIERIAKAKQLKAYLLIFEQFLANYLSQLSHFKDVFSLNKNVEQSYFTQSLKNVPNSEDLFLKAKGNISDAYLELDDIPKDYFQGLEMLSNLFDNFTDRRNRFLDFLLATHGESFSQYTLQQFNFYFSEEDFDKHLIKCKTALLQNLGELNYNRQVGYDYLKPENNRLSGLEQRLAIFLAFDVQEQDNGLTIRNQQTVLEFLKKNNVKLVGSKGFSKLRNLWMKEGAVDKFSVEQHIIEDKFDFIDDLDFEGLEIDSINKQQIIKKLLPYKSNTLHHGFLSDGIQLSRYKIGKVSGQKGKILLVYDFSGNGEWITIGDFDTQKEALIAVKLLIENLIEINIRSESMTMVEHILLRPSPEKRMYGIYIDDESGQHILKSDKQFSLDERSELLKEIEKHIFDEKLFSVEADENRDMNIIFDIPKLKLKFRSIKPKSSVEDTHSQKELLYEFLADKKGKISFDNKVGFYIQYSNDARDIPEEFFSFQISLVMPNWSARFQNKEFRSIASDIIIEQKPANVYANIDWLEPEEMVEFDKLYKNWQKAMTIQSNGDDDKFNAVADLSNYLYNRITSSNVE
jgi:hypothetical protein